MAGERSSSEADRKLEAGTAKSPEPTPVSGGSLHPAFYIALWISLSSSVIIFNKWILTTAKFGATPPPLSPHYVLSRVLNLLLMPYCCLQSSVSSRRRLVHYAAINLEAPIIR